MQHAILRLIFVIILTSSFINIKSEQIAICPKPHQIKWSEAELGVVFHYDLHVFDGKKYSQGLNRVQPIEDYNIFNPKYLDTDQWIKAVKEAGAKFAILTVTHETGFALYQSDANAYCLKAIKWRDGNGDIVKDFVTSCRKYGVAPGLYIGIRWNAIYGIHNFKAEGEGEFAKNRQQWYKTMCENMVTELCSRYGELFMIWFDGGADDPRGDGPNVEPIINRLQPSCLFYHNKDRADLRWGGSESGTVKYPCWASYPYPSTNGNRMDNDDETNNIMHGNENGQFWVPAMADSPLRGANGRHEWFWEPDDEDAVYPLADLMEMYEKSVGRNATLILGITPDTLGLVPETDAKRLAEFGQEIQRRYGTPLSTASGKGKKLILPLRFEQPVNAVIIRENIAFGQRIREYKIEALVNSKWIEVCNGTCVGNKRIEKFPEIKTSKLRITVKRYVGEPIISEFKAFYIK